MAVDQPVPAPAAGSELDTILREIAKGQSAVRESTADFERRAQQEADDRSMITRVVIYVFGGSIAGVLLVILVGSRDTAAAATDLLKSVVLPVVTLVLGYYFGRAGKS